MLVADPAMVTADMVEEILKFKRLDGALAALTAIAAANYPGGRQSAELRDALAAIEVPVQVIWGESDRVIPPAHAEGLPETIAVTRISGAGHIPHMEKSSDVNALIKALG